MATATAVKPKASAPAVIKPASAPAELAVSTDMSNLPSWMEEDAGLGKDNIGSKDIETPRLKLIQGVSPEIKENKQLRPGNFFHTSAEHIFEGPFRIVPIFMDKRYVLWQPREMGGGILARADDGLHWQPANKEFKVKLDKKDGGHIVTWKTAKTVDESGLDQWGSFQPGDPDSPPAATLMYSFVVAFPDHPDLMPAVLSFQRSSLKAGRRFNTKLKTTRAPMFGLVFEVSASEDSNGTDDFYNINVVGNGRIDNEAQYRRYKSLHADFAQTGVQIKDLESMQDDEPTVAAEPAEPETMTTSAGKTRSRF